MELHRAINPDWRFSEPVAYLLAELATIESERLYIDVARAWNEEESGPVPERYWPTTYGPPRDPDAVAESVTTAEQDDDDARAIAAQFASMQLARGGESV